MGLSRSGFESDNDEEATLSVPVTTTGVLDRNPHRILCQPMPYPDNCRPILPPDALFCTNRHPNLLADALSSASCRPILCQLTPYPANCGTILPNDVLSGLAVTLSWPVKMTGVLDRKSLWGVCRMSGCFGLAGWKDVAIINNIPNPKDLGFGIRVGGLGFEIQG